MSNNIYDILGKLNKVLGDVKPISTTEDNNQPIYENVEPRGDIIEAVKSLESRYMEFKQQVEAMKEETLAERELANKDQFDKHAEVGDYYKTADGNKVTKTSSGIKHEKVYPGDDKDELDEKAVNPYAVGMAQAMKSTGDKPPLKKSTIKKAHKIAKAVDEAVELNEGDDYFVHATELTNYEIVVNANSDEEAEDKAVEQIEADREEYQAGGDGVIPQYADKLDESKADIRNHPIYTNEEAWDHYKKELDEQESEKEEAVDIEQELGEIAALAGLAEKVGGNQSQGFVDDITKDEDEDETCEGFDPESYDKEIEYEFAGDDGEPGYGHVQCHVNVVDGRPVVDPTSLTATCNGDGNNKLTDEWCSEMVAIGGSEHEEALKACQEEVEDEWESRDVDVPMDESAIEEAVSRKDFRMVADLLKQIPDEAKRKELAQHHAGIFKQQNPRFKNDVFMKAAGVTEDAVDEGNEFTKARLDAIAAGKESFTVDGKTFKVIGDTSDENKQHMEESVKDGEPSKVAEAPSTVTEDINLNVSATGEEDVVNLIRKLSGMPMIAVAAPQESCETCGQESCGCAEGLEEERDVEYANTPNELTAPVSAAIPSGNDLHKSKVQDPKTANKAANPLAEEELEESLWTKYEDMLNDIKA